MNSEIMWSNRYRDVGDQYLFGTDPSHFLAYSADYFQKGESAILLADGEGRNSVWLAERGLNVTATEISPVALQKAERLASTRNVAIDLIQSDMLNHDWQQANFIGKFDWVIGIFIQFADAAGMARQFKIMKELARPGGSILLHGYTREQLKYKTGGPSDIDNLYSAELLIEAFSDWKIKELIEYDADICEGLAHNGQSALIGMIAQKIQ